LALDDVLRERTADGDIRSFVTNKVREYFELSRIAEPYHGRKCDPDGD
jgi:hypothetical protein